jgi:hypothetical protein
MSLKNMITMSNKGTCTVNLQILSLEVILIRKHFLIGLYMGTEYYTEVHLHCFLRKLYSS